ncbi:MAG: NAD(+)--rifampin ADP-ribosyltransferase [Defluviitaleaceae bacterium]|nr:NAD(+)--rifampin ADP-ribosyltransferase [Defluviitaleaceae bacterium]
MDKFNLKEHQKTFTPVGIRKDVKETDPLYHGTKASLKIGDLLQAGHKSNFGERERASYIYLSATMDAAVWGAELAVGDGKGRIYIVEPTGAIDDDPNLTDMRFAGNPTRSYRTKAPLRIIGEVSDWEGHSPEAVQNMRDRIAELSRQGYGAID